MGRTKQPTKEKGTPNNGKQNLVSLLEQETCFLVGREWGEESENIVTKGILESGQAACPLLVFRLWVQSLRVLNEIPNHHPQLIHNVSCITHTHTPSFLLKAVAEGSNTKGNGVRLPHTSSTATLNQHQYTTEHRQKHNEKMQKSTVEVRGCWTRTGNITTWNMMGQNPYSQQTHGLVADLPVNFSLVQ